jgi:hypothetical protein
MIYNDMAWTLEFFNDVARDELEAPCLRTSLRASSASSN